MTIEPGHYNIKNNRDLSPRELQVSALLVNGDTNKLIASKLKVSEQTVKNQVRAIYKKIGASYRIQAILILMKTYGEYSLEKT